MLLIMLKWIVLVHFFQGCSGQESFVSEFHMEEVTGKAILSLIDNTLTVSLNVSKSFEDTRIEIHPLWMDYDTADKCSDQQLGTSWFWPTRPSTIQSIRANTLVTVTFSDLNISTVEGQSIVLRSSNKTICATIQKEGEYKTALARFTRGSVSGYVYFRQAAASSAGSTRVVTDLYSRDSISSLRWKITGAVSNCASITSRQAALDLLIYNPNNASDGVLCTPQSNSKQCAVGNLSGRLGDVSVGQSKGYSDNDLPLTGETNIGNKLLVVYETDGSAYACAIIKIFKVRNALVKFSHDGVTGTASFSQNSPFDPTVVQINFQGLNNNSKGFHIHSWPTPTKITPDQDLCGAAVTSGHFNPYNKNVNSPIYPQPDASTDDMYEVGDLSSKYGTLANLQSLNGTYTDWNLPLFGANSIIGRSLVIHHNDPAGSRWVCANVRPLYPVVTAKAIFKYPVIGQILFMQEMEEPDTETSTFIKLDYNDGRAGTQGHLWKIYSHPVASSLSISPQSCNSTGTNYDPFESLLQRPKTLNIPSVGNADVTSKFFFTDLILPLSGSQSIIGRSLVIMNLDNTTFLSCTNIELMKDLALYAQLSSKDIKGIVYFTQTSGFGAQETTINYNIAGLQTGYSVKIFELPPSDSHSCDNLGPVFNPFNITSSISMSDDNYQVGNIARFFSSKQSPAGNLNLPLAGVTSILGRSLAVVNSDGAVVACTRIENYLNSSLDQQITAVSRFTGDVNGTILMYQTLYADGTMSDTTILVDLKNLSGTLSYQHNWHTHSSPVNGDNTVSSGRCSSTGPHFDPYKTMMNETNYANKCSKQNLLQCEVGDQAKKVGAYDLGGGRRLYTDIDLPLSGPFTVQGRAMVVHDQEHGAPRLGCADIIPNSDLFITIFIKTPPSLDKRELAKTIAKAVGANNEDVVVENVASVNEKTELKVYFTGQQGLILASEFAKFIADKDNYKKLSPYQPIPINSSYHKVPSIIVIGILFVSKTLMLS
ncbi:uncharacterized protein LOC106052162 isoform X1 [Biomphalaria glabrata]|uniref:Uncharacterized protein LOC106052162 isoform X1 n=1 Tax=Biomphalaria glabrata TaxID=6526 RepID=A0A9W2YXI5_BIOGL|nr:uncharacterized protein LOC106052162 isoform X1 [Biomphalaria glabrata]